MIAFLRSNWLRILAPIVLVFFAGMSSGVLDTITHRWSSSVFAEYPDHYDRDWWYPGVGDPNGGSWMNKYKDWPEDTSARFFGSKTFLVFVTDAWHFFKFLYNTFFTLAILLPFVLPIRSTFKPLPLYQKVILVIALFAVLKVAFSGGFMILWTTLVN